MSTVGQAPAAFQIYNSLQSKRLAVVVDIEGLDYLSSTVIGRVIQYGDPLIYGGPYAVYGGLVPIGFNPGERGQKNILSLDGSSLTISQRLEPEQGRAAISTLSMTFIDKDQYMTQVCTPGLVIDEILGREVKIWIGYAQTTFPDAFYVVWRGRVSQINPDIGKVTLQFSDPNMGKRGQIFYSAKTTLSSAINSSQTTIPVANNSLFHKKILGPDSTYDLSTKLYLKIDDEIIEYQQTGQEPTGFGSNQFLNVIRGSRFTTATAHDNGANVEACLELSGHAIDLALKTQLSGWNGPYKTDQDIFGLVITNDPIQPTITTCISLKTGVDAVRDLGLAAGDYITVSGAANIANNGVCKVLAFVDSGDGQTNKIILTDKTFIAETTSTLRLALRSQYDTLPTTCGVKLPGWEVDVAGHLFYKDTYLSSLQNSYRFFITDSQSCKTWIESEIMLPLGAYCLTRLGKLSMGLTKPAIADARSALLDHSNVIAPQNIRVTRGVNNRKFFNEIQWEYDYTDDGKALSIRKTIDFESLALIGVSSVLPIKSKGARKDLGFDAIAIDRERFLLNRYARGSVLLDLKTNFGTGNQIEAGDVVILSDNGELQIPNMQTGKRDYGQQLLEVINRSLDIKTGEVQLQLQGGIGALVDDRYATIAPSSLVTTGSTTTKVVVNESFGVIYPTQEWKKWADYVDLPIVVRSYNWTTRYAVTTLKGFDPADKHGLLVSPALPFTPQAGDIVEVAPYDTGTDPLYLRLYKIVHAFQMPSIAIVSGLSDTQFTVSAGDIGTFNLNQKILVHDQTYATLSPEVTVTNITGTTVTVGSSLGFTPAVGQRVELIGFKDGGGSYRFI